MGWDGATPSCHHDVKMGRAGQMKRDGRLIPVMRSRCRSMRDGNGAAHLPVRDVSTGWEIVIASTFRLGGKCAVKVVHPDLMRSRWDDILHIRLADPVNCDKEVRPLHLSADGVEGGG